MVRQTKKQKLEESKKIKELEELKSIDLDTFSLGESVEVDNKYKWFDDRKNENSIESITIRLNKLENILKSVVLLLSEYN
jgi:hypothetical protein